MKVSPPQINERALRHHLRAFRIGDLVATRGVSGGVLGMLYEINTTRGRYVMRLADGRLPSDARFEEALLKHLEERAFPVAPLLKARHESSAVPVTKNAELSLFHPVPGRALAAFEVNAEHARQVGAFLAAMHLATKSFRRVRRSRSTATAVARTLERVLKRTMPDEVGRDARALGLELTRHLTQRRMIRGVTHGDLTIDHARFVHGELRAVLGFGGAANGPLAWDIAVALCDWGFSHDRLLPERAAALVAGYESVRELEASERGGLFDLTRYAATRSAILHLAAFEVPPRQTLLRYRDYRHSLRRLDALRSFGAQQFRDKILGRSARER
jgi:homoserine kinase type II